MSRELDNSAPDPEEPPSSPPRAPATNTSGWRARAVAVMLPSTPAGRMLMVAFIVDTLGTGLFAAGSVVFFTRYVRLGVGEVATGLSAAALIGLVVSVPLGMIADRFGIRRTQVLLHIWRASGFVLFAFCGTFSFFLLVVCMIGVGDRSSPTLNQALVSLSVPPDERVRTMGLLRAAKNVSFSIGGLGAAIVLAAGSSAAYLTLVLVNAASYVAVAVIVARLPLVTGRTSGALRVGPKARRARPRVPPLRDRRYVSLAAVNGLLGLHNSLLLVGIPLFVLKRTTAPAAVVALLFVINTVLVAIGQVRVGRITAPTEGAALAFRLTGVLLAVTCLLLLPAAWADSATAIAVLIVMTVALSLGEMLQSAAGWDVSFALAPAEKEAEYLSVFNLGTALEAVAGPALVTLLVLQVGWIGWTGLAAVLLVAGLAAARLALPPPERGPAAQVSRA